ncbi:unnamed protein product [Effrenium voratum]|uniref:Transmembrane protein n=1 Tax=Effrenium voratum TaxID=2562239 RepID=A0AA36JQM9_9DINO|nr:unnamed protein product [Effrenium voratum]|mmetsp:Transcript_17384/g.41180  ORF Transcript_17384/g.41180 Transcript_17384/m.41180 type:complete len:187 (+) Transcript_17384:55-615(+)|eukprot:CAMPEP_0181463440 /NCGR_PEP_ID=MMETSP1110-20121109/34915_1 /TAXON_ID=174948 /ORGANISM="Symbiodinium sp., Strain CCMP421" /LENGTH=186 /DNA_ID=CAMNT_0023588137 /DNA_START=27 /DNA_END=587 /DNA_ORIENTATION=-
MAPRRSAIGRRGTGAVLAAALLMLAPCFALSRGSRTALRAESAAATPAKADGPSEEAIKTRSIFMSLDSDEFGIDMDQVKKSGIPTEETEPGAFRQVGDFISGPFILPFVTILVAYLGYYCFFTKEAENAFYYSAVNEKAMLSSGEEDSGFDFRALNPDMVSEIRQAIEAQQKEEALGQSPEAPAP